MRRQRKYIIMSYKDKIWEVIVQMKLSQQVKDTRFLFLLQALAIVLIVANLLTVKSLLIGFCGSVLYLLIGGNFVGLYLLEEKQVFVRVALGVLVLLLLMSVLGWLFIIFRGLGVFETAAVLVATFAFLMLVAKLKVVKPS